MKTVYKFINRCINSILKFILACRHEYFLNLFPNTLFLIICNSLIFGKLLGSSILNTQSPDFVF